MAPAIGYRQRRPGRMVLFGAWRFGAGTRWAVQKCRDERSEVGVGRFPVCSPEARLWVCGKGFGRPLRLGRGTVRSGCLWNARLRPKMQRLPKPTVSVASVWWFDPSRTAGLVGHRLTEIFADAADSGHVQRHAYPVSSLGLFSSSRSVSICGQFFRKNVLPRLVCSSGQTRIAGSTRGTAGRTGTDSTLLGTRSRLSWW